jgi:signal transduction histidine kinase/integral membrane sensor domain MASE1
MTSSPLQSWRYLLILGAIAAVIFIAGRLSLLLLGLEVAASPLWPPAGVAMAAVIWQGRWACLGVGLGILCLNTSIGAFGVLSAGSILGNILQPLVGMSLLQSVKFQLKLDRPRDVLGFVGLAALITPMVNATISTWVAYLDSFLSHNQLSANWWTIWLGDGMGILVFTPPLLLLLNRQTRRSRFRLKTLKHLPHKTLELFIGAVLLLAVSGCVFYSKMNEAIALYPLEFLPFPFVIWAALRFNTTKAILASLTLSLVAISGTVLGLGPFITKGHNLQQSVSLLQAFIGVVTITTLVVGALNSERQRAETQLRRTAERNRLLNEIALRIRQSLDLDEILQRTVAEVRHFLQADRVFISRHEADGLGRTVAESVAPGWTPALGLTSAPENYAEIQALFAGGEIRVVNDTSQVPRSPFIDYYYSHLQIRASMGIPIILDDAPDRFFGVLVVNQCSMPRQWQPLEIELLEQLGNQVAIAIQQAQLYQQVQRLNNTLEHQVAERTLQLQQNMVELGEQNQLREVFFHAIAHDLRTTVMGTLMVLKTLQSQPGEQVTLTRSFLERMLQSGEVQLKKLNSLLEVYTNKTEGLVLHCKQISPTMLVETITEELEPLFAQNQSTLLKQLPPALPQVWGDAALLQRVLQQLLTNAVKHNPPGVCVSLKATVEPDVLRFTVEDDGRGIQPEMCDRLFDLRIHSSQERQLTGISVGLYLCYQIITAHGGEIGVDSTVGTGSNFWFTLPLSPGPQCEMV